MGADGHLNFDTKIDSSGFNSGISKLGSIAKGGMAVLGSAVVGGIAAFAGLTKASLDSVASLEQNIGGIETLFGAGGKSLEEYAQSVGKSTEEAKESYEQLINAQNLALENANKAYATAGLSANEYMETVTSFAASLKQSVANEADAARIADMAVIDMADNANKMGTSMESVQNAYQGFAKQNYTMLDNLKLGYGGTKTEMQRLLKDAQALTGVKYDINNLSDVYSAIHVIQEELGVTGTTAKEASKTIAGSMSAAQAAWDNFLAGTGTAEEFASAFGTAAANIISNVIDIVPRLASTIPTVISQIGENLATQLETSYLGEVGLSLLESVAQGIQENAPILLEKGLDIISNLMMGISVYGPQLIEGGTLLLQELVNGLISGFPNLVSSGCSMLLSLVTGLLSQLPYLITQAVYLVVTLANSLLAQAPTILQTGFQLIGELINGILQQLPSIIESAGTILTEFCNHIIENLPEIVDSGAEMLLSVANGIVENLPEIISAAASVIADLLGALLEGLPELLEAGITLIAKLAAGIIEGVPALISEIPGIIEDLKSQFSDVDWGQVGSDILNGIANGIVNGASAIITAAKNAAKSALNAAKDFLEIRSPSRRFRDEVGAMMAEGMGIGFEDNIPTDDMTNSMAKSVTTMQKRVGSITKSAPSTASAQNTVIIHGEKDDPEVPINITNVFEVDGEPLVTKTVTKTIKTINKDQQNKKVY